MLTRCIILVFTFSAVALGGGCEIEQFFPKDVGAGAARLTVRNAVKLIALADADTNCGFSSKHVQDNYVEDGELGGPGTVTWTVDNCVMDFGDTLVPGGAPSEDCNGEKTTVSGKVTLSATRTVTGTLTGNPENPVIPSSPDAVAITVSADVQDYQIRLSDKTTGLTMHTGHVDESASIHLAQNISLGVCGVPTSDVTLNSIKVTDATYTVDDDGHIFDVDVPSLEEKAQLGVYGDFENYLEGKITVWDSDVDLNDDHVLDPDYKADEFANSFACVDDLKLPVEYVCKDLTPQLADGAAKLTVNNVGNVISVAAADTRCGFMSPGVIANAQITGDVGHEGGEAVFRIDQPCALVFPTPTEVARDCSGKTTYAEGTALITGTMRLRGRLSGDPSQPVIPTSRDPASFTFHIDFQNFRVTDSVSDQSLEVVEGGIDGRMEPRMAQDTLTGACSIPTPVSTFDDLAWQPGAVGIVRAAGNALRIDIDGSSLSAQNGNKDGVENKLAGDITVNGTDYQIPLEGAPILDPNYDAAAFNASYACTPNMAVPASDAQCNFHQVIADGAARLVIQTVGTVATMVNGDSNCGFEDQLGVLIFPSDVQGNPGDMGSMTWDVSGCTVGDPNLQTLSEDCSGGATFYQGTADVNATRTVLGERTTQFLIIDAIEPRNDESVTIWLDNTALHEFVTYPLAAGESEPIGKLTIHDGTLSATVEPATGARADDTQTFDVPTPVARISNVHLRNAHATLEAQGKTFEIEIPDTDLSAVNGSLDGVTNQISGTITVDGDTLSVGGGLNPTYDQSSFDDSYACTDNLAAVVQ